MTILVWYARDYDRLKVKYSQLLMESKTPADQVMVQSIDPLMSDSRMLTSKQRIRMEALALRTSDQLTSL